MANQHEPRRAPDLERTGALLVMFREECDANAALSTMEARLGYRPERSGDYATRLTALPGALRQRGMVLYEEFGMAILDPSRCSVDESVILALRESEHVQSVRPEYRVYASGWLCRLLGFERRAEAAPTPAPAPGGVTWGLRAVGADVSPYTGQGIKIAVLDTGFDRTHPDFAGRDIVLESFVDGEGPEDGQGHGTHTAGTAAGPRAPVGVPRYGVATGATLYVGKVLDNNGSGREGDILAGILWALREGCQIVSMSLGRRPMPGDDTSDYERVGRRALDQGSLIIAAVGNESSRGWGNVAPVGAPANAPSIMAVGAVDEALKVADFSNGGLDANGGELNICAPGVDVLSSIPGGGHAEYSGTSMATPHVSGLAALWAESDPSLRGRALWEKLEQSAKDIGLSKQDGGAGLAQAPGAGTSGAGTSGAGTS